MKKYIKSAVILLAALSLAGCSKTEEFQCDPDSALQIESVSGISPFALTTKAVITDESFPGDEAAKGIGLFVTATDGSAYDGKTTGYSNVKFTYSSAKWSTASPVYLSNTTGKLYGYFPYSADATDPTVIPVQSSLDGTDYLYAKPQEVSFSNKSVNLQMNHALARLHLTIKKGDNYPSDCNLTKIVLQSKAIDANGTLDITTGAVTATKAADATGTFELTGSDAVAAAGITKDILLVPADNTEGKKDLTMILTIDGTDAEVKFPGNKGLDIRSGIQNNVTLNVKTVGSKMEVVSVGVDGWDDKVSGNTAEVDGHTVTFNCPDGLKYSLHLEQETSGSFDEQTSGTLKQVLTFSYDGSAPSLPQEKFLAVEGPASGCGYTFDKTTHTITVTDVTTDVSFNLSLGDITFIQYTATAKVEPNNKKIGSLPLNEEKSTFNENSGVGVMAIEGELTAIGEHAFEGNTALTGITLPKGITAIYISAFDECHNLVLPQLPKSVAYIGKYAFRRAGRDTKQTTDLVLPDDLTTIERYAFEECRIKTLTGNAKLATIWIGAFKKCNCLTDISFKGQTAPTIEEGSIFIETDLTKTGGIAVPKTTNHTSLLNYKKADWWKDIPNGIIREEGTTVTLIPYTASAKIILKTKDNPTDYSWGDGIEYVSDDCCSRYDADSDEGEWFFIGEGSAVPTQIPAEMFKSADPIHPGPLQSITIPEGVIFIGKQAFYRCENLTSISFPATLETIEAQGKYPYAIGAFENCNYLTVIDLSGCSKLKEIPIGCFSSCNRVTSLKLPEGLESIGEQAFINLGTALEGGLQSLVIPASLKELRYQAFYGSDIKSVTLYSELTSGTVNEAAFQDSKVESVTFEDGAQPQQHMFLNCTSLKTVTSKSTTPPDLYPDRPVFNGCSNITTICVPKASVNEYKASTKGWSNYADKIQAIGQ